MGTLVVRSPLPAAQPARPRGRVRGRRRCSRSGRRYLYFSRFAREDIYLAAITLALIVVDVPLPRRARAPAPGASSPRCWRSPSRPRSRRSSPGSWSARSSWPSSLQGRRAGSSRSAPVVRALRSVGVGGWAYALATFARLLHAAVHHLLHQTRRLWDGALRRASTTGSPSRRRAAAGSRWCFYSAVLFGDEWPVLLLGAVGIVLVAAAPDHAARCSSSGTSSLSLAFYSWAGERFAWLVLHPLLPLILLAGIGVQALGVSRRGSAPPAGSRSPRSRSAYAGYASLLVNAVHGADPRELLVSTQSSTEVKQVADQVARARRERRGAPPRHHHDRLRRGRDVPVRLVLPRPASVGYIDMTTPNDAPDTEVLVHHRPAQHAAQADAAGLRGPAVPLPRLVGARLGDEVRRPALVELVHRARDVEPHGRACPSGSTCAATWPTAGAGVQTVRLVAASVVTSREHTSRPDLASPVVAVGRCARAARRTA